MPDQVQEQHERAVGDRLMEEYNRQTGKAFVFRRRAGEAPDLVYEDGTEDLRIEVTDAYENRDDARMRWGHARGVADAPDGWTAVDSGEPLLDGINGQLVRKALNSYGGRCVLVINLYPTVTSISEVDAYIPRINIPAKHSFSEIYLVGDFPATTREPGGYKTWRLA